jgi:hypothetical protein
MSINVEILACGGCGRHVLCVADDSGCGVRIHDHKCNGQWTVLEALPLSVREAESMIEELQHIVGRTADLEHP